MNRRVAKQIASLIVAVFVVAGSSCSNSEFVHNLSRKLQGGGAQQVSVSTENAEVAFSPSGGATDLVTRVVASAQKDIYVAAYSFTSMPIAKALLHAKEAGVSIHVVVDNSQANPGSHSVAGLLASKGIPVRVDFVHAIQHDKYMIVDGKTVETGSFNYTASAESRNSENVLVLWNNPKLAEVYKADWQKLWDLAEPYEK